MTGFAACLSGLRLTLVRAVALAAALACAAVSAQPSDATPAPDNSALDAPLFYQLLIGEIELRAGHTGNAYEVILDAARRQGDDALFQRAVDIALQSRSGEQALAGALAWRKAKPKALAPLRYQAQILLALNRGDDAVEPLAAWLAAVPTMERPGLIAGLPRLLQRLNDPARALAMSQKLLRPYLDDPAMRTAARVALGEAHLAADDKSTALELARTAQSADPAARAPVLLALRLLPGTPEAEGVVTDYLARADADPALRLAYVRLLTQSLRYADASRELDHITHDQPQSPEPWLTLGALRLELKQPAAAEAALLRYVELAGAQAPAAPASAAGDVGDAAADETDDEDGIADGPAAGRDLTPAWLLLSQSAEARGNLKAAEAWLAKIDNPQRLLDVQSRRAGLLARQGKVREARALIQSVPERTGDDARAKLLAEAQMLRDVKRWREASEVLAAASRRYPDDTDVLYEQAMVEEKLNHLVEMERLLRRVIELKPEHSHAHNALGYSLADRGLRLPEARDLIRRALQLSPGDPFITDSLGWVEFRMGNPEDALRLLRQAYNARPDTEIAAHLGEVLWAAGQRSQARQVWQEARSRDAGNEILRETLSRLKVSL